MADRAGTTTGKLWPLKLAVSVALFASALRKVDWSQASALVRNADPLFLFLSFAISPLIIWISVVKWRACMGVSGRDVRLRRLVPLYLASHFFNHILPSNVGGDVFRIHRLRDATGNWDNPAAAVFLERFIGLTALLAVGVPAVILHPEVARAAWFMPSLALVAAGYAAAACLAFRAPFWRWLGRRDAALLRRVSLRALGVQAETSKLAAEPGLAMRAGAWSLLFYVAAIANVYLGCRTFGEDAALPLLAAAVPVILVIAMLPVAFGGVGLQEWAYVVVFEAFGWSAALGLSVGLLMRLKALMVGAAGGIIYAGRRE